MIDEARSIDSAVEITRQGQSEFFFVSRVCQSGLLRNYERKGGRNNLAEQRQA